MKIRNIVLATAAVMGMSQFANAATVEGGTVRFDGNVVAAPCAVASESSDQVIYIGQVTTSQFTAAGQKANNSKPFSIKLTNCSSAVSGTASVTFNGIQDQNDPTLLRVGQGADAAVGVALGIYETNGTKLNVGDLSRPITLLPGQMQFDFTADYVSTQATVSAGDASGVATFAITYS
ncbi:type 1 fimbria pilin [Aeromonas hydrophila]|uniref:fimbrial protein n=1 Tax=Aeromonas hydrophila TaxID=644 RepID=UPI00216A2BD9|nr:fimbrial protein [Aeromonas hydrophila]MCS3770603.1 type 1 fimbria pilin [Aeromonas hydrophila]MCS3794043.1 type 1 fimbria pilin [Aeromonas hydrophila]